MVDRHVYSLVTSDKIPPKGISTPSEFFQKNISFLSCPYIKGYAGVNKAEIINTGVK
jgi:hypothetical protein